MPVWEAQYIIVIAARTGWTEEFIRWELPLSRGYAYYHAARLLDGERMTWPGGSKKGTQFFDSVKSWARKFLLPKTTSPHR